MGFFNTKCRLAACILDTSGIIQCSCLQAVKDALKKESKWSNWKHVMIDSRCAWLILLTPSPEKGCLGFYHAWRRPEHSEELRCTLTEARWPPPLYFLVYRP